MSEDPWKHRSENMSCKTCMWYVRKAGRNEDKAIPIKTEADLVKVSAQAALDKIGRCRRHAPTMSGYPVVFDTDFCGDHKVDENKI